MHGLLEQGPLGTTSLLPVPDQNLRIAGKSVRRDVLETQFDAMLRTLRPTPELFELASEMFRDLWNARMASEQADARHMRSEVVRIEKQIEQLVGRIVASDVSSISTAFENRVRTLEIEMAQLSEKIALCGRPAADFDTTYRTAMEFLTNPYKLWVCDNLADKRTVLKLAFAAPIAYARNQGFRTAEAAIPFRIFNELERLDSEESEMVRAVGIEPTWTSPVDFESTASTISPRPQRGLLLLYKHAVTRRLTT